MAKSTQVTRSAESGKQQLSKEAKRFNSLMEQIHKKETKLQEMTSRLEKNLEEYNSHVFPLVKIWKKSRIKKLILIAQYIQSVKISNYNMTMLLNYITDERVEIDDLQVDVEQELSLLKEEMEKVKRFLIALEGDDPEEVLKYENEERQKVLNETKELLKERLNEIGVELNLDELHVGLSDEEIADRLRRLVFEATAQAENLNQKKSDTQRKKTKKQLEKEEIIKKIEADKDNSLSGMYKKLAKLLHPDTAVDDASRAEKTEWMKQLSAAYQAKDLKTMLKIEMEWLKMESNQIDAMSEEKLMYYNSFLSKQVNDLQHQISILPYEPRFYPMTYFLDEPANFQSWKLDHVIFNVLEGTANDDMIINDLCSTTARKKKIIKALIDEQIELEETRMIYERMERMMR